MTYRDIGVDNLHPDASDAEDDADDDEGDIQQEDKQPYHGLWAAIL